MPTPQETRVTRADAPKVLEYNDVRWELEAFGGGTRLTLWHNIDRRFISMLSTRHTLDGLTATMSRSSIMNVSRR